MMELRGARAIVATALLGSPRRDGGPGDAAGARLARKAVVCVTRISAFVTQVEAAIKSAYWSLSTSSMVQPRSRTCSTISSCMTPRDRSSSKVTVPHRVQPTMIVEPVLAP
jgi:hypothetical protein